MSNGGWCGRNLAEERDRVVTAILEGLDCPRALTAYLLWKYEEHDQLALLQSDPNRDWEPLDFARHHAATKLLSKADFLSTSWDRAAVAYSAFLEAEKACLETNERLSGSGWDRYTLLKGRISVGNVFHVARRKIASILGPFDHSLVFRACNFGPGATTRVTNPRTGLYEKFRDNPHVTTGAELYARALMSKVNLPWKSVTVVDGNVLTNVPKNSKTDRIIAKEPDLNIFFQKSLGSVIQNRLERIGISLEVGQTTNNQLAREGSRTGLLSTIDLKAASDTISFMLVMELLPWDWFNALDNLRSHRFMYQGVWNSYEKFSSMGNGFTFPLQSLLFYALCDSVRELCGVSGSVSVYGDDLIVPTDAFGAIVDVLAFCGFETNIQKSFSTGYFRESCGGDYYDGVLVQPLYLKEYTLEKECLYKIHNGLLRLAGRLLGGGDNSPLLDKRLEPAVSGLIGRLRAADKLAVPGEFGDLGLWSKKPANLKRFPDGTEGWRVRTWAFRPKYYRALDYSAAVFASLWSRNSSLTEVETRVKARTNLIGPLCYADLKKWVEETQPATRGRVPLRNRGKYRYSWARAIKWTDPGDWSSN